MTSRKNQALILALLSKMQSQGSWCGETHIQKLSFLAKELKDIPLTCEFILYKHGPYSFDLKDELDCMLADELVVSNPCPPYGPKLKLGGTNKQLFERYPNTIQNSDKALEFIAMTFSKCKVGELERYATALYMLKHMQNTDDSMANQIHAFKPHINKQEALDDIAYMRGLMQPQIHA